MFGRIDYDVCDQKVSNVDLITCWRDGDTYIGAYAVIGHGRELEL